MAIGGAEPWCAFSTGDQHKARAEYAGAFLSGPENLRSTFECGGPHLHAILRVLTIEGHCRQKDLLPSVVLRLCTCRGVNTVPRVPSSQGLWRGPSLTPLENSALKIIIVK